MNGCYYNKDLEEDIKDLEKYIIFANKSENFSHDTDWKWNKELAIKIKNLINRNKELEEYNMKYIVQLTDEQYRNLVDIIRKEVNNEWKSKVIEKIEELKEKMKTENNEKVIIWLHKQIRILQELLEE